MDRETLLVIDDDVRFQKTLCNIFQASGYTTAGASTGKEALAGAAQMPAVALIDLNLPDMNGLEILQEVHAISPHTESIVLTGYATQESVIQALNQGAYGYMQKPCDIDQLLLMIQRAMEKRRTGYTLQESERRLKEAQRIARVACWERDFETGEEYWSDEQYRLFGYEPQEVPNTHELFRRHLHPEDLPRFAAAIESGITQGRSFEIDCRYIPKNGEARCAHIICHVQLDDAGKPRWMQGTFQDTTERRQTEQELLHLERLRAVGELSAGVSHNLNNILTTVLGPAQIIKRKTDDPELLREIDDIILSTHRARDLVHALHLSVRTNEEEALHPVSVDQVVQQAVQMSRPRWKDEPEAQGVSIRATIQTGGVPPIQGTEAGMHDILTNLIFNAVDAMPEGGTISILTGIVEDQVQITFSDTGTGMDEATRLRIFEPFFTTKMNLGTGLGLSTVYNTVSRWGGTIEVDSAPGEGTLFTLRFPVWTEEDVQAERKVAVQSTRSGRSLVVDDDEAVGGLLSRLLGEQHEVEIATDGRQVLEQFALGKYDVALIDLGMSGMSGDRLMKQMKEIDPQVVTVLITGWTLPEIDPRALSFDFHIAKPFGDLDAVEDVVARAVALHDQRVGKED